MDCAAVGIVKAVHTGPALLPIAVGEVDALAWNGQATAVQLGHQRGRVGHTSYAGKVVAADGVVQERLGRSS